MQFIGGWCFFLVAGETDAGNAGERPARDSRPCERTADGGTPGCKGPPSIFVLLQPCLIKPIRSVEVHADQRAVVMQIADERMLIHEPELVLLDRLLKQCAQRLQPERAVRAGQFAGALNCAG